LLQEGGIPLPSVLTSRHATTTTTTTTVREEEEGEEDDDEEARKNKENHQATTADPFSPFHHIRDSDRVHQEEQVHRGGAIIGGNASMMDTADPSPTPTPRRTLVMTTPIRSNRTKQWTPVTPCENSSPSLPPFRMHFSATRKDGEMTGLKHGPSPTSVMVLPNETLPPPPKKSTMMMTTQPPVLENIPTVNSSSRIHHLAPEDEKEEENYMFPPSFPAFGFQDDMMMSMVLHQTQLQNLVAERLSRQRHSISREDDSSLASGGSKKIRHGQLRRIRSKLPTATSKVTPLDVSPIVASSTPVGPGMLNYKAVEVDIVKFIHEDLYKKGPAVIRLASHSAVTYKKLVAKRQQSNRLDHSSSTAMVNNTSGNRSNNNSSSSRASQSSVFSTTLTNSFNNDSSTNLQRRRIVSTSRRTRTFPEELRWTQNAGCMGATELTVAKWMEPIRRKYASLGLSYADFYTLAGGKSDESNSLVDYGISNKRYASVESFPKQMSLASGP
jgi:hypothetical protein